MPLILTGNTEPFIASALLLKMLSSFSIFLFKYTCQGFSGNRTQHDSIIVYCKLTVFKKLHERCLLSTC